MQVMVKVGTGRNDPVHKPRFHQRDQAALAQAGRSERTGQAHADVPVVRQHLFDEQMGRLAHASAVVGKEHLIDEIGRGNIPANAERIQTRIRCKLFRSLGLLAHGSGFW